MGRWLAFSAAILAAGVACLKCSSRARHRFMACLLSRSEKALDYLYSDWKAELLGTLRGTVVEIGPGTGPNLRYLRPGTRWIGVEPNPHLHGRLRERAERLGLDWSLHLASAECLPVGDDSVDAVVATLVLCSVNEPRQVLREIRRVLKPEGRFVFLEHVAGHRGTWTRRLQEAVTPLWAILGDGCHPNRETGRLIQEAGFELVRCRWERAGWVPIVAPHIAGSARLRTP